MLRKLGLISLVLGSLVFISGDALQTHGDSGRREEFRQQYNQRVKEEQKNYHKYRLSDFVDTDKAHDIWIEDPNLKVCYPVGELKAGGAHIIFVDKKK